MIYLNYLATKKRVDYEKKDDYVYYSFEWFAMNAIEQNNTVWSENKLRINQVSLQDSIYDPYE